MALLNRLSDIQDFMATTLDDFGPPSFRQCAQRLQHYEIFTRWMREDKVVSESGDEISRRLMLKHRTGNKHKSRFARDTYQFSDVLSTLRVPFVTMSDCWTFNYGELIRNRGKSLLTNIIEPRRTDVLLGFADDMEQKGWGAPSGPDDVLVPFGVSYWVVKNATQGFNGGYPSGFTNLAGINLTNFPNFKNYTDAYSDVSEDDLCFKMNQAKQLTFFVSPPGAGGEGDVTRDNYRVYCNNGTKLRLNKLARARNESYGLDLAYGEGGAVMHAGNPIVYVPQLDLDTSDPVYMLNHEVFAPYVEADNFLRESPVKEVPGFHDQYAVFLDHGYNYVNLDRRRETVIAKF